MIQKKLHLGCGTNILKGYINLDIMKLKGVDVTHNLNKIPYPFKNNTFDEIVANHVIEHLENILNVVQELSRISKNGAILKIRVPYYNSQGAFQDPTHTHFFAITSFDYFTKESGYGFYSPVKFKILKKEAVPTRLGRIFPKFMRIPLSLVFGEFIRELYFELKVIKK